MVIGLGVDIVDLDDLRARLTDGMIEDLFTEDEIGHAASRARSWESYGARFAAKEAAFKALGAGLSQGLRWRDVEVRRDPDGRVSLELSGAALARAREIGVEGSRLSLAHSARSAVAVVILEGAEPPASLERGGKRKGPR